MPPPFCLYFLEEETHELGKQINKSLVTPTPQKVSYSCIRVSNAKPDDLRSAILHDDSSPNNASSTLSWCTIHLKLTNLPCKTPARQGSKQDTEHYLPLPGNGDTRAQAHTHNTCKQQHSMDTQQCTRSQTPEKPAARVSNSSPKEPNGKRQQVPVAARF